MPNEFKVKNGLIVDQGGATITGSLSVSGSITTSGLSTGSVLFTSGSNGIITGSANLFWDNTNGRLGIKRTPAVEIDVDGSIRASSIIFTSTAQLNSIQTNGANLTIKGASNVSYITMFQSTGNLLLQNGGTFTDAGYRLDVNGNAKIKGSGATSATTALRVENTNASASLVVLDNGFIGINTGSADYNLDVNGTARVSGTTTITPAALTGTAATSALDIAQTWNTTGAPTAIKLNVTDTASAVNTSLLMDLQVGGASRVHVSKTGTLVFRSGASIRPSNGTNAIATSNSNGLNFISMLSTVITNVSDFIFVNNQGNPANTTGVRVLVDITRGFQPTSGTGQYIDLRIAPTINQTGGANGITRGLFIQPTLTSAADFRAIETTAGNVCLNTTSGNTLIGTTTDSGFKLDVSGSARITNGLTITGSLIVSSSTNGIDTTYGTLTTNGSNKIDWQGGVLVTSVGNNSVDWENYVLNDSSATPSVAWNDRILNTPGGNSFAWDNEYHTTSTLYQYYGVSLTTQNDFIDNLSEPFVGQIIEGTVDAAATAGQLVNLEPDGTWYPVKNLAPQATKMLGICVNQGKGIILLEGDVGVSDDNTFGTYVVSASMGLPVYVGTANGDLDTTQPTNGVVRTVGHIYYQSTTTANYWLMKFRPSNDWYEQ